MLKISLKKLVLSGLIFTFCLASPQGLAPFGCATAGEITVLSLTECLQLTLENHPSLRQAASGTREAEAQLERLKSNKRATVSATSSLNYNGDYEAWDDRYHSENVGISLSKLIYDTGRNRLQREAQTENLEGSRQNERQKRVTAAAAAKRAYYDLVLKLLNREVEREKLKNLEEHLERAKGLYDVGKSAYIDVTKAEADAAGAKVSLLRAENDVLVSREALSVAMGVRIPFDSIKLSTELLLPQAAGEIGALLNSAMEDRPDYLQALHTLRVREINVKDAARSSSPSITGQLSSNVSNSELKQAATTDYGIRLSLTLPIVDGGAAAAAVASVRAQVDQQTATIDELRHQIDYNVRKAALTLASAIQQVHSSEISVRYAEENLELAKGRYEVGIGNAVELSDAVSQLASSRYTHYQALYNAQAARADLDEAMGHLPPELVDLGTPGGK